MVKYHNHLGLYLFLISFTFAERTSQFSRGIMVELFDIQPKRSIVLDGQI